MASMTTTLRTALCLALGINHTAVAFTPASRHGRVRSLASSKTTLMSTNDPDGGAETMSSSSLEAELTQLKEASQAPNNGQMFGGTFSAIAQAARGRESAAEPPALVEGGSLRTWTYRSPFVEQVQVVLSTEGHPLDADVELRHGPDNVPCKMRVYVESGQFRPFSTVLRTPRGPNTVAIRNIGQHEFPFTAHVAANGVKDPSPDCAASSATVESGALRTYPFDGAVDAVQVLLRTDGRPLNARIELLQGPDNNKQVIELYTEDGFYRPFFCVLETPGADNVVRVVNTAPAESSMTAAVVPHARAVVEEGEAEIAVLGGDVVEDW